MTTQTATNKTSKSTKTTRAPQGAFAWFELRTPNAQKSAAFYAEVVGWKTETMSIGPMTTTLFSNGHKTVAHMDACEGASSFVSYVAVDDVDAAAKRVSAAGGKLHGAPVDIPTVGRMLEVEDPDGAHFFLYKAEGDGEGQPKAPGGFHWNELWARNEKKAIAFLTSVLGYSVKESPMPDFMYHVLLRGETELAGVMPAFDKSAPSSWVPYIHVTDTVAAQARALKLGARPLGEVMTVPNVGTMAVMVDPLGACFAVMTPAT